MCLLVETFAETWVHESCDHGPRRQTCGRATWPDPCTVFWQTICTGGMGYYSQRWLRDDSNGYRLCWTRVDDTQNKMDCETGQTLRRSLWGQRTWLVPLASPWKLHGTLCGSKAYFQTDVYITWPNPLHVILAEKYTSCFGKHVPFLQRWSVDPVMSFTNRGKRFAALRVQNARIMMPKVLEQLTFSQ